MANIHRKRFEMIRTRVYPASNADKIEVGDLLVLSAGKVSPLSSVTDSTGATAAARIQIVRDKIANDYVGMALQAKDANKDANILVAVDVVAEYDLPAALGAAADIGAEVEGHASDDGATASGVNQQVNVSAGTMNPIGMLAKPAAAGDTTVTVHLVGKNAHTYDRARMFATTASVDPAAIAAGAQGTTNVSIPGVEVGDTVVAIPPSSLEAGLAFVGASVTAQDTVAVTLTNHSAAAVDGVARTWGFLIVKR